MLHTASRDILTDQNYIELRTQPNRNYALPGCLALGAVAFAGFAYVGAYHAAGGSPLSNLVIAIVLALGVVGSTRRERRRTGGMLHIGPRGQRWVLDNGDIETLGFGPPRNTDDERNRKALLCDEHALAGNLPADIERAEAYVAIRGDLGARRYSPRHLTAESLEQAIRAIADHAATSDALPWGVDLGSKEPVVLTVPPTAPGHYVALVPDPDAPPTTHALGVAGEMWAHIQAW